MAQNAQPSFYESNPEYATLIFTAQDARKELIRALTGELDKSLEREGDPDYERYGRPSDEVYLSGYLCALQRVWSYEEEHPDEARRCKALFSSEMGLEG